MTDEELDAIEARLNRVRGGPGNPELRDDDAFVLQEINASALIAEVRRLRELAAKAIPELEYAETRIKRCRVPDKGDEADWVELAGNVSLVLGRLDEMLQK